MLSREYYRGNAIMKRLSWQYHYCNTHSIIIAMLMVSNGFNVHVSPLMGESWLIAITLAQLVRVHVCDSKNGNCPVVKR